MNKKLYRVEVCLYVMAEDEYEACWAATNARFDVFECTAAEAKTIDLGWEDAVPYNSETDRSCSEILTSQMQLRQSEASRAKVNRRCAVNAVAVSLGMPREQADHLTLRCSTP